MCKEKCTEIIIFLNCNFTQKCESGSNENELEVRFDYPESRKKKRKKDGGKWRE